MAHRVDFTDRSGAKDFPGRKGSGGHRYRREDRDELATTKPGAGWGNFRGRLHRVLDIRKEPKAIDVESSEISCTRYGRLPRPQRSCNRHRLLGSPEWMLCL